LQRLQRLQRLHADSNDSNACTPTATPARRQQRLQRLQRLHADSNDSNACTPTATTATPARRQQRQQIDVARGLRHFPLIKERPDFALFAPERPRFTALYSYPHIKKSVLRPINL
jgi:hypothetical protein